MQLQSIHAIPLCVFVFFFCSRSFSSVLREARYMFDVAVENLCYFSCGTKVLKFTCKMFPIYFINACVYANMCVCVWIKVEEEAFL